MTSQQQILFQRSRESTEVRTWKVKTTAIVRPTIPIWVMWMRATATWRGTGSLVKVVQYITLEVSNTFQILWLQMHGQNIGDAEQCGDLPKDLSSLYDFKPSLVMSALKVGSSAAHVGRKSAIEHSYLEKQETWREKDTAAVKR